MNENELKAGNEDSAKPINVEDVPDGGSGSIPDYVLLPVSKDVVGPLNTLSKDLQVKLRKQEYDFSKVGSY